MKRFVISAVLLSSAVYAAPAMAEDEAEDGPAIVVTGARPSSEATAGTKSSAPIAETPQSISVISAAEIADLGLSNLNQALRFVAGVTTEQRGSSAEVYDQFKLRGFDAPQFLDGLKLIGGASYLEPQIDVSRLDRIEVIKGPASVLYGQSGPGGLVALSSKLPLDKPLYGAVSGTYGSYDLYRADADVGGKIGDALLWRINGSVNGAHTQQTFSARERQTVSGALTFNLDPATKLTLLGAYSNDPQNGSYGVFPASGTFLPNPNGQLATSTDFGEPGNYFKREQVAATYILTHEINPDWNIRASGRYQHGTARLGIVYASGSLVDTANPNLTLYNRASYATRERSDSWVFDNQIHGRFATGTVKHDVLFGVDYQTGTARSINAFGSATPLNGYAPVYGTMVVPQSPAAVPNSFSLNDNTPRSNQAGVYAQDQLSLGALRVLLSGRQDWASVRTGPNTASQDSQKFTYRAGALYTLPFGLAPYVSYSTSFEPNGTLSQPNGVITVAKPSEGKQIEAGAKYTVPGTQILVTGAWFRIDQTNLITTNPLTNVSTQSGRVRSSGVEVEASAPLPYGFNAKLAYSRQKVRTTADANPANIGAGILGVGRGGVSGNLEWAPRGGKWQGFAIGGAVRHVDSIYAGGAARTSTPGFTLVDALVRFDLGTIAPRFAGVSLGVNAANLFDKKYVTTCYLDYAWCWYGNRRTVQGTIAYRF
ncbi:TonB-dependent siderophore receptor [Sphingomonas sp. AAP5]|uniref:TonB-dependent siderophore receptor n=1 Tax=Sphingomonas sp. AAP5 TaxID=1523415 RepID=UPI001056F241|nr:TonB-dependent siderophore receptor [Sphingomonas sp. AAP5]QBM74699.1 TonB-dependent siderophore receptor [Sphingomonas sp. AAP5]